MEYSTGEAELLMKRVEFLAQAHELWDEEVSVIEFSGLLEDEQYDEVCCQDVFLRSLRQYYARAKAERRETF